MVAVRLDTVSRSIVHPKLRSREAQRDQIEKSGYPTIHGIL